MRFASIGSGSEGNGLIVEAGATRILVDCGFGVRDTTARLERLGVLPQSMRMRVVPASTRRPLPSLPLPIDAKRTTSAGL